MQNFSPRYFKTFYIRRACRIFPLYFSVTGLVLFMYLFHLLPGTPGDHQRVPAPWAAYLTLTQNWWWSGIPLLGATWSLCVEEQFYLIIPFVIRNLTRRQLVVALVSVVAAAPLLRVLVFYHYPHGYALCYVLTPCRADALCLGVLSAVLVRDPASWRLLLKQRIWLRGMLVVLLLGVIHMTRQGYTPWTSPMNTIGYSWMALFYTFGLLTAVSSSGGIMHDTLCHRRLMGLGTLAYCAYLIHVPLLHAGRRMFGVAFKSSASASWLAGGMLGIVATLIIASVSWEFFEKPLLRMGHRYEY